VAHVHIVHDAGLAVATTEIGAALATIRRCEGVRHVRWKRHVRVCLLPGAPCAPCPQCCRIDTWRPQLRVGGSRGNESHLAGQVTRPRWRHSMDSLSTHLSLVCSKRQLQERRREWRAKARVTMAVLGNTRRHVDIETEEHTHRFPRPAWRPFATSGARAHADGHRRVSQLPELRYRRPVGRWRHEAVHRSRQGHGRDDDPIVRTFQ